MNKAGKQNVAANSFFSSDNNLTKVVSWRKTVLLKDLQV